MPFLVFLLGMLIPLAGYAQEISSRSLALANADGAACTSGVIGRNPASISGAEKLQMALSSRQHPLLPELSSNAFSLVVPLAKERVGALLQQEGTVHFRHSSALLAFAHSVDRLVFGLASGIAVRQIPEYLQEQRLLLHCGMMYHLNEQCSFGSSIRHLPAVWSKAHDPDRQPLSADIAGIYRFSEQLTLFSALQKGLFDPLSLNNGLEYRVHPILQLRMGYSTRSEALSAGFGLKIKKQYLNIASVFRQVMGPSLAITLSYAP